MSDIHAKFLLPPEIFDGGSRMDPFKFGSSGVKTKPDPPLCFPSEFPYDVFSSPATTGFSEIESDEDGFLAGLTRRLTRVSLDRAYNYTSAHRNSESMLNQARSWSGRSIGSGNGSQNGPSMASPRTTTPPEANYDAWNLIYQAAGQVARLKLNAGDVPFRHQCLPGAPRNINPVSPVKLPQSAMPDVHFREARGDQAVKQQAYIMWNRQIEQQKLQNRRNRVGFESGPFLESERRGGQLLGGPGQTYCRPNMKTAFFGGGGGGAAAGKRECAGTGVFLPRRYGNSPTDSRNKIACPMNKNSEGFTGLVQPQPTYITDHDILFSRKRAAILSQQMKNLCPDGAINHELRLPQEWTY